MFAAGLSGILLDRAARLEFFLETSQKSQACSKDIQDQNLANPDNPGQFRTIPATLAKKNTVTGINRPQTLFWYDITSDNDWIDPTWARN
ncbi:hypothetical protein [Hyphomonas sp. CACIAM 19H1]|uniref:hypothetical protein n=1 Tax=Hyphomonas sp. CACIAM 19H1 TaxID=1873716 RepID=UPI001F341294|nr:hypothetical protein [Hyphomonas sp. CACIAM 19H1]